MLEKLQNPLALLGRLLIAALFLPSGLSKIAGFAGTVGYVASQGLPAPTLLAAVAVVVEVGFTLLLVLGWGTRWVALGMAVFTVLAGVLFHNFWAAPADEVMMQTINFYKNIAIAGGLLFVAAFGPGALSVDARRR
ncbi:MAG: DoxX family protein [Betaproteobacteria bacterium]|nr:DoxX family protein [Betaproteobacteria bacterium]